MSRLKHIPWGAIAVWCAALIGILAAAGLLAHHFAQVSSVVVTLWAWFSRRPEWVWRLFSRDGWNDACDRWYAWLDGDGPAPPKILTNDGASGTAPVTSGPGVPARAILTGQPVMPLEGRNSMNLKLILASLAAAAFHATTNVVAKLGELKVYSQLMGTAAATELVQSDPQLKPYATGIIAGIGGNAQAALQAAQAAGLVGPALLTAAITDGQDIINHEVQQIDNNPTIDTLVEAIADPLLATAITNAYNHLTGSAAVAAAVTPTQTQSEAPVVEGEAQPA